VEAESEQLYLHKPQSSNNLVSGHTLESLDDPMAVELSPKIKKELVADALSAYQNDTKAMSKEA
jgi:hypothetical protein